MTHDELFEEVRSLLRETQASLVGNSSPYPDEDLVPQMRSALRHLSINGVGLVPLMDEDGSITGVLSDMMGLAVAHYVAEKLILGDTLQKLRDGELGIAWRAGSDAIDTKGIAGSFERAAALYGMEYQALLLMLLATNDGGSSSTFGDQLPYAG